MPIQFLSRLRGSPFAFPLAALAALAMFVISESSYQQASSTFETLGSQGMARNNAQLLWRSLLDAETGQRGYLLTGRKEYLRPYESGVSEASAALQWLNAYYGHDAQTMQLMSRVSLAARNKLSELVFSV